MRGDEDLPRRLGELAEVLEREHGRGSSYRENPSLSGEPDDVLGTLLVTILSQASSDSRTREIWARLNEAFPSPSALLEAPRAAIEEILRPGGLARQKSSYIRAVLRQVREDTGEYSLEQLHHCNDEDALNYLTGLPGVGIKTAACVMLFGLERDVFPVDTHVARIARRVGLVAENAPPDRIHRELAPHMPEGLALALHLNLLEHGRTVCLAVRPRCERCVLSPLCVWYREGERKREVG